MVSTMGAEGNEAVCARDIILVSSSSADHGSMTLGFEYVDLGASMCDGSGAFGAGARGGWYWIQAS